MYTIIVGGGKVGVYLASLLLVEKHQIKIIDNRKERIAILEQSIPAEMLILGEWLRSKRSRNGRNTQGKCRSSSDWFRRDQPGSLQSGASGVQLSTRYRSCEQPQKCLVIHP